MPCIQARRRLRKNLLLVNTSLPHASEGGTVLLAPLMYTKDVRNLSGSLWDKELLSCLLGHSLTGKPSKLRHAEGWLFLGSARKLQIVSHKEPLFQKQGENKATFQAGRGKSLFTLLHSFLQEL